MSTGSITLWSVEESITALLDTADMVPPEQQEEYQQALAEMVRTGVAKRDSIYRYVADLEMKDAAAKAEIERLAERRQTINRRVESIKGYLLDVMRRNGVRKLDGTLATFSIAKCPPSVEITNEDAVPAEFKEVKQSVAIVKGAVKSALQQGREVPGARLITDKETVRIR